MHQFLFLCACFAGFLFAIKNINRVTRIKQSELIRLPAVILPHHISETVRNIIRLKREENNGKTVFSLPKIFVLINIPMAPAITNERIERSPSCAVGSGVLYAIIASIQFIIAHWIWFTIGGGAIIVGLFIFPTRKHICCAQRIPITMIASSATFRYKGLLRRLSRFAAAEACKMTPIH